MRVSIHNFFLTCVCNTYHRSSEKTDIRNNITSYYSNLEALLFGISYNLHNQAVNSRIWHQDILNHRNVARKTDYRSGSVLNSGRIWQMFIVDCQPVTISEVSHETSQNVNIQNIGLTRICYWVPSDCHCYKTFRGQCPANSVNHITPFTYTTYKLWKNYHYELKNK